ncbi:hypothetical protein RHECNPAF_9300126 [Rhizobium etli CNPAF512]|nr:hypothetical protein RHECNPAF_9300126 [Rhizobium etli CNPAF512]
MHLQDFVEACLRLEAERRSALGIKLGRPAGDDAFDDRIGHAFDERGRLVAGHAAQSFDFFGDQRREARHGEISPRADPCRIDRRGMDEEADGGARACEPVPHVVADRQDRFLADQRFAQDVGEEARCRLVRCAGPHADGRQPDADAVENAAAGIVGEQQFGDRLLRAVARQRRGEEFVRNDLGERCAKDGDRGREDEARHIIAGETGLTDRIEQSARAVEIHGVTLVEIRFRLARYDGGEMEDQVRPAFDQPVGGAGPGEVDRQRRRDRPERFRHRRLKGVRQRQPGDGPAESQRLARDLLNQLAADHTGRAQNHNMHSGSSSRSAGVFGKIALLVAFYDAAGGAIGICPIEFR